jgi:hypothetical protein
MASDGSFITPELAVSGWSYAIEPVGITKDNALTKAGLMEQINTTADASDFLWYSTRYTCLITVKHMVMCTDKTNFY